MTTPQSSYASSSHRKKLLFASGIAAGAVAGAVVALRRNPDAPAEPQNESKEPAAAVDWDRARAIATSMNRGSSLTLPERKRLDDEYRALQRRVSPIVGNYMKTSLPESVGEAYAYDRVDWINANIDAFRTMLSPFEPLLASASASSTGRFMPGMSKSLVSLELGVLLGYLARRVLGQYDVALLGREPMDAGKLFYVEPNIAHFEKTLNLPGDDFRTWLALHETTHVYQFEAFPWLRNHFNQLLEQYFEFLKDDAEQLTRSIRNFRILLDRVRSGTGESGSWMEAIMNEEQRALFNQMQAMMCVIEGYSNHVMNAVGKDLLPTYDSISKSFQLRQKNRSQAEQLFAKITGLDVKMEQYRQGEQFIDSIVKQQGHDAALRLWEGPQNLPTMQEIKNPGLWMARVLDNAA